MRRHASTPLWVRADVPTPSRWTAAWGKAFDIMPPIVVSIIWVGGIMLGAISGALLFTSTPSECTVMAHTADKQLVTYENLATSTRLAVSRGRSEYDQHEADIAAAYEQLGDLGPVYREAKAACLGGAK